jgi:hypothetical protein
VFRSRALHQEQASVEGGAPDQVAIRAGGAARGPAPTQGTIRLSVLLAASPPQSMGVAANNTLSLIVP